METRSDSERTEYLMKFKETYLAYEILLFGNIFFVVTIFTRISPVFLIFLALTFVVGAYLISAYYKNKHNTESPMPYLGIITFSYPRFRNFEEINKQEVEFLYALIFELMNEGFQWAREMVMLRDIKKIALVFFSS